VSWVDLHSHVLPGLDDGPSDMETSLQICEGLHSLGFSMLVATPHVRAGVWDGTPEEVTALGRVLEDALLARLRPPGNGGEVDVRVCVGGEHYLDAGFIDRMERGRLLEYPRQRGVLVEVSLLPRATHPGLRDMLFRIRVNGLRPVLAHPERYDAAHRSLDWLATLHQDGVGMLGDLMSLVGRSGRKSRRTLEKMMDRGILDGLCTDAHAPEDVPLVEKALNRLEKLAGRGPVDDWFGWGRGFTG
jgi:protein-tyrosine phosphatase